MNRLAAILPVAQVLVGVEATSKKRAFEEAGQWRVRLARHRDQEEPEEPRHLHAPGSRQDEGRQEARHQGARRDQLPGRLPYQDRQGGRRGRRQRRQQRPRP